MTRYTATEIAARHAQHRKVLWLLEDSRNGLAVEVYFEHCPDEDEGQRWQWVEAYHGGRTASKLFSDEEAEALIEHVNMKEPACSNS